MQFGEKSTCFKTATLLQNYDNLLRDLLENKTIFVDENFSVNTITLTDLKGDVVWKRPFVSNFSITLALQSKIRWISALKINE